MIDKKVARVLDYVVMAIIFASGLLNRDPSMFYASLPETFLVIAVPLALAVALSFAMTEGRGFPEAMGVTRIQGLRKKDPPVAQEALATLKATFVVACMSCWPVTMSRLGLPTGLVWFWDEMNMPWWMVYIQMFMGIVAVDAWTYGKHRLLHTRLFYPFHMQHHTFTDPTPFASFAVGPLETLITFAPLLLVCIPEAKHFAPLYYTAVVSFVLLNLYLHSGVTSPVLEKILPWMGLNSSGWHNIHHSHVNANFGEVSFVWDLICETSKAHRDREKAAGYNNKNNKGGVVVETKP